MALSIELGPTIAQVVDHCLAEHTDDLRTALIEELISREQGIATTLSVIGIENFGLHPEFIADVFAQLGVGEPLTTEERTMIHENAVRHMQELMNEQGPEGSES